uniref:DNA repair protein RadA n=1 Tax=candidate division CPR3 bacterium TaxID=2268181 RepID=A0A7V3N4H4_UNCC3
MKDDTIFVCTNCGAESLKWSGRCFVCGEWNTMQQVEVPRSPKGERQKIESEIKPEKLKDIKITKEQRISTEISEFDRVLGGGIVLGALILLGGEPGIGKSTLLLQIAASIAKSKNNMVLYVSGEESAKQLKMRADRLNIDSDNIYLLPETNIDSIIQFTSSPLPSFTPSLIIIDSIQTMYDENYPSTPGSLVQVRECAIKLKDLAKTSNIPIFIVGHVTKEGAVAGPKTLEHLVDVVLYLEGERFQDLRILHGVKNRFGAIEEVGVFQMQDRGLSEVKTPSRAFLEERMEMPGSAVTSILSGTRAFLVEIQTLISKTPYGYPKRIVSGFDFKRLDLLLAVLQKRIGLPLSMYDVYVNIVGGMKIEDRAADLALCASIFSIFNNKQIRPKTVLIGEVGLSGELRTVGQLNKRVKEAKALGFDNVIGPEVKTLDKALKLAIEE